MAGPDDHAPSHDKDGPLERALREARAARGGGLARQSAQAAAEIPGYTILHEIHRGGQGVVYKAIQDGTRRSVAIKVMLHGAHGGPRERARFAREARVLSQIRHPGVVTIHETGETAGTGGVPYSVMDYVEGATLDEHIKRTKPDLRTRLELFRSICEAVNAAHLLGIIHRDLKPANIRVTSSGEAKVLDFGLAKVAGSSPEDESGNPIAMTMTGQFMGSIPWASPEQADGRGAHLDTRTDVYSLGVILYQLLTDRFPYTVQGPTREVLTRIVEAPPAKPRSLSKAIDRDLEVIVLHALEKAQSRRYQTAGELARDLERYLDGRPILARSDSMAYLLTKQLRRHRVGVALAGIALLAIIAFTTTITLLWGVAERRGDRLTLAVEQRDADLDYVLDILFGGDDRRQFARDRTVRDVVLELSQTVDERFADEPLRRASMHEMLGRSLRAFGEPTKAETHLRDALRLRRDESPSLTPETLGTMNTLAEVLKDQGRFPEAILLYQQVENALRASDIASPIDRRRLATVLANRGRLMQRLGFLLVAQDAFQDAVDLLNQDRGDPVSDQIGTFALGNLAGVRLDLGAPDEAVTMLRGVHTSCVDCFGEAHPATWTAKAKYAQALVESGDAVAALPLAMSCIESGPPTAAPSAYATAARAISAIDGPSAAISTLGEEQLLEHAPVTLAQCLLDAGEPERAIAILTGDLSGVPTEQAIECVLLLHDACARIGDPTAAHRVIPNALARSRTALGDDAPLSRLLTLLVASQHAAAPAPGSAPDASDLADAIEAAVGANHRWAIRARQLASTHP